MSFTIFMADDTLCSRENNRCKQRNKCRRYLEEHTDKGWVANYWQEFGQFCDYFMPIKSKRDEAKEKI